MLIIEPIRNFYARFERPISSFSLVLGFIFDALTLKRVDALWENIWILGHLVIVGIFIILIHHTENSEGSEKNPNSAHFWYVNILQFFFGGLFSAYLVLYFRSSDIFVTWPFIAILLITFIANESLKRHYVRLSFQISLFFLSIYSFTIFWVPVVTHKIGTRVFLASGIISLIIIAIFLKVLFYFIKDDFTQSKKLIVSLIVGIFILINFLYFTNLIPPIPLSLKDAGVYHSIQKNAEGGYEVTYEDYDWTRYLQLYPDFKKASDAPVYAYSAIFSPKDLDLTIIHEWQHFDEMQNKWTTAGQISLPVVGGRDGGFRTYSARSNLGPGKWRVNIKTLQNKTIGRLRFNIMPVDAEPILTTRVL
ncbi:MAG TPA: DUF2914 domain-containing protein [Candidatus Paceibacterota bacterium]|nr:DUF2914 domain-containing protein [Candidatus Paceibacterota bacterium]